MASRKPSEIIPQTVTDQSCQMLMRQSSFKTENTDLRGLVGEDRRRVSLKQAGEKMQRKENRDEIRPSLFNILL